MANQVFGPFVPINIINGTTPVNATWGNNAQLQASDALHGFNPDLLTPFVLSGVTCTKDGSVANQLDIASGRAYVTFTDGTVGLIVVAADNTHTTVTPSTTYFLDLNPDGSWSWGTSHSGVANHLSICSATTDGSGNILVVTDARTLGTTLLSAMMSGGTISVPAAFVVNGAFFLGALVSGSQSSITLSTSDHAIDYFTPQAGATAYGHRFVTWDGAASHAPFSVGGQFNGSLGWMDNNGNLFVHNTLQTNVGDLFIISQPSGGSATGVGLQAWTGSAVVTPLSIGKQVSSAPSWISSTGAVAQLAGQATAGSYGVPPVIASAKDLAVAVNTSVTVCTATTPNDGKNHLVRFGGGVTVGAGASNNGVCNFSFAFPDPNSGAQSQVAPVWNGTNVVAFSAFTVGKGLLGASTTPTELLCAPNATVSISYQNTAAGTISDKVSGVIELLT